MIVLLALALMLSGCGEAALEAANAPRSAQGAQGCNVAASVDGERVTLRLRRSSGADAEVIFVGGELLEDESGLAPGATLERRVHQWCTASAGEDLDTDCLAPLWALTLCWQ